MRTRRQVLWTTLGLLAGLPIVGPACRDTAHSCVGELSTSQRSLRQSLDFTEVSAVPVESCRACHFFTEALSGRAEAHEPCGHCSILAGLVPGAGRCSSWSARA